jgi:excinuclease ABC subunit A
VRAASPTDVVATVDRLPAGTRFSVAFPATPEPDADPRLWAATLREEGFVRIQAGDKVVRLDEDALPALGQGEGVFVLVDRLEAGRTVLQRLTDSIETAFARGQGRMALLTDSTPLLFDQRLRCPRCGVGFPPLEPRLFSFNDPLGACPVCEGTGELKKEKGKKRQEKAEDDDTPGVTVCPSCHGTRLREEALVVRVAGKTIAELCALPVKELTAFCEGLRLTEANEAAGRLLLSQILARLGYLNAVELGYLSLDRAARSLSTGESQRVRLTTALGSNLAGALYVLDEPTAGLHPRDTEKLLAVLLRLRDSGNTLIVVEHDAEMIRAADHLVELGPGAGEEGGRVVYQGAPPAILDCDESPTGAFLSGRRRIAVPSRRRELSHGSVRIVGARTHNLRDLTVDVPLGVLCVVTGVSGAGKSALVQETLYPALCRRLKKKGPAAPVTWQDLHGGGALGDVLLMDQTPLARTVRSNPATYIKVFDDIREVFADTAEARARRLEASAFSFNQPGGRCETCAGVGTLTVDMQFLADVTVTCPECGGTRYQREVLDVKVRSLSIAEVLDLTAREAFRFFRAHAAIERRLKMLLDVGLDYMRLGQPADTLSGGESQRLKLAGNLAASRKPRCLFLLDEPTTGLHTADVVRLLDCFDRLLETGHSLIVVEHDLDVIKCADHVIDLGPGAGAEGGTVVAEGTPEAVAAVEESHTGRWLRHVLTCAVWAPGVPIP